MKQRNPDGTWKGQPSNRVRLTGKEWLEARRIELAGGPKAPPWPLTKHEKGVKAGKAKARAVKERRARAEAEARAVPPLPFPLVAPTNTPADAPTQQPAVPQGDSRGRSRGRPRRKKSTLRRKVSGKSLVGSRSVSAHAPAHPSAGVLPGPSEMGLPQPQASGQARGPAAGGSSDGQAPAPAGGQASTRASVPAGGPASVPAGGSAGQAAASYRTRTSNGAVIRPTARQERAAELLSQGMPAKAAFAAAGYSDSVVRNLRQTILRSPGVVLACVNRARKLAGIPQVSPAEQEAFVRTGLLVAAQTGEHQPGSLRALELLGRDSRVGMFQPDGAGGVVINIAQFAGAADAGELAAPLLEGQARPDADPPKPKP